MTQFIKYFLALLAAGILAILLGADVIGIALFSAASVLASWTIAEFGNPKEIFYWRVLLITLGVLALGFIGWIPHRAFYVLPGIFVISVWISLLTIALMHDQKKPIS